MLREIIFIISLVVCQAYTLESRIASVSFNVGRSRSDLSTRSRFRGRALRSEHEKRNGDNVEAREKEFHELLDSMLCEAKMNIENNNIDMNSAEAMMMALSEAKKLNLTEEEAAEQERKAVEDFSESFVEFIDGMVKIDEDTGEDTGEDIGGATSFAEAFGGVQKNSGVEKSTIDNLEIPTGPLSMSEALKMINPLRSTLSKEEWDETMDLLNDVTPEERFDICSFMVRARMKPTEE